MEIYVSISRFAATRSARDLRDLVRRLEDAGVDGVNVWDHVFCTFGEPTQYAQMRVSDPLMVLGAIAGMSDSLGLQTGILNSDWHNPGLLFRQYNQLAVLGGGHRVTAGIGAGWGTEEFKAVGAEWNPMSVRLDRLEETLKIATQLYDQFYANFEGTYRSASNLPLTPVPPLSRHDLPGSRPALMIGGGSDRIMEMAGKYCNLVDLHGSTKIGGMTGATTKEKHFHDVQRRAQMTMDHVQERLGVARAVAKSAGRPETAITATSFVLRWVDGSPAKIKQAQEDLCRFWGHIPPQPLDDNPYLLFGSPAQMADTLKEREEKGMSRTMFHDEIPMSEVLKLMTKLMPLLK